MNRDELQLEAIKTWVSANKVGTLVLPTGTGKTYIGVTIAARQILNNIISSVLVVVPTVNLIDQWRNSFTEFYPELTGGIEFMCIKSAYKVDKHYDLLIVDEAHTTLSPEYRQVYSSITYNQVLCLTATMPEKIEYQEFLTSIAPVVYTKTLDEVQEQGGILAEYKMYNLEINFNRQDRSRYKIFDGQFKEAQMELTLLKKKHSKILLESTFDIARKYSALKNITLYLDAIKLYKDYEERYQEYAAFSADVKEIVKYSKQYWSGMTMRKWTCYESTSKLDVVINIMKRFPNKKWIIFNKSIKFAERLAKLIPNSLIYHSKMKPKDREDVLAKYREDTHRVLIAVDALNAGLDIPSADAAITVSGVSTELVGVQTLGRIIRFVPGKTALFINLFTKDTVEESWTKNRTESFKNCVWVNNLMSITL